MTQNKTWIHLSEPIFKAIDAIQGDKHNVDPPNILDSNSSNFHLRTASPRTSSPSNSDDPTSSGALGVEDSDIIDSKVHPKSFNSGKKIKNYKKKEAALESEIGHREELIELLKERFKKDEEARQKIGRERNDFSAFLHQWHCRKIIITAHKILIKIIRY
jgi:hypothetical protein